MLAVGTACVTGFILGPPTLRWHLVAGAAVAALLLWRVVWGVLGGPYARFAGFAYGPRGMLAYLRAMRQGRAARHLGHNPMGAAMVFVLLLVLAAILLTGIIQLGGALKQGPLRAMLTYATGAQAGRLHRLLAFLLLGLIGLHLAGVGFESWRERENLVGAMLTGRKRSAGLSVAPPTPAPVRAAPWRATAILLVLGLGGAAGIAILAALPGYRMPPATLDPGYVEQCGSCHLAFPPSLARAAAWNAILDRMDRHFGEDTGLDAATIAPLRAYLDANAAGHWDSLPANRLAPPDPGGSLRLTDTPGWRRIHRAIPAAVFAAAPVYRRSDCAACHADAATGRFAPQDIAVPGSR